MKTIKLLTICTICAASIASCGQKTTTLPGVTKAEVDSVSYAVGVSFGGMLKASKMSDLNYTQIMKAMQDVVSGKENLMVDEQKAGMIIQSYMMKVEEASAKLKEQEQAEFLAKNKTAEGVQQTESGLQYKIENPGNEVKPQPVDTVEVNYKGMLLDGTVFDSSYDRGESVKFPLNGVIKGWTEGLQLFGEGGKGTLWIPYDLGYGPRAIDQKLPGYSTLVFEVELIKVIKAQPQPELKK